MKSAERAERIVRDLERVTPYFYEGLYNNFLKHYMDSDKSKWSQDLAKYLITEDGDGEVGEEIASVLWDRFEQRISC
ncbi:MAG: hypothetical protein AB1733_09585 [Thermodesulfobacteriota bacterium]